MKYKEKKEKKSCPLSLTPGNRRGCQVQLHFLAFYPLHGRLIFQPTDSVVCILCLLLSSLGAEISNIYSPGRHLNHSLWAESLIC